MSYVLNSRKNCRDLWGLIWKRTLTCDHPSPESRFLNEVSGAPTTVSFLFFIFYFLFFILLGFKKNIDENQATFILTFLLKKMAM